MGKIDTRKVKPFSKQEKQWKNIYSFVRFIWPDSSEQAISYTYLSKVTFALTQDVNIIEPDFPKIMLPSRAIPVLLEHRIGIARTCNFQTLANILHRSVYNIDFIKGEFALRYLAILSSTACGRHKELSL